MGGDRSLGVFGVADAFRLESTPSMCKNARTMCVNMVDKVIKWGKWLKGRAGYGEM